MQTTVRKADDRLQSILRFCEDLPAPLKTPSALGPNFAPQVQALSDALARLAQYKLEVSSGAPEGATATRHALRSALRTEHLEPIRRVARALAHTHPEIPRLVRLPAVQASVDTLLNAARAIARDVAPYHDLFVADGLPADFVDQLSAAIQAVAQSVDDLRAERQKRAAARTGIRTALTDGRLAARHLDPLVRLAIRAAADPVNGPIALAAWKRACHLERTSAAGTPSGGATPAVGSEGVSTTQPGSSPSSGSDTTPASSTSPERSTAGSTALAAPTGSSTIAPPPAATVSLAA